MLTLLLLQYTMSTNTYMILTVYYPTHMLSTCMPTQPTIDLRLDHTCTKSTLGWDSSIYLDWHSPNSFTSLIHTSIHLHRSSVSTPYPLLLYTSYTEDHLLYVSIHEFVSSVVHYLHTLHTNPTTHFTVFYSTHSIGSIPYSYPN